MRQSDLRNGTSEQMQIEKDPLAYNPSIRKVTRTESDRRLLKELKVKLNKNNSFKQDLNSPYVRCQTLDDVVQTHDNMTK